MASALVTVAGSGAISTLSTTVLLTVEEMLDALGRAQRILTRPKRQRKKESPALAIADRLRGLA
jgi:hypothetical protein